MIYNKLFCLFYSQVVFEIRFNDLILKYFRDIVKVFDFFYKFAEIKYMSILLISIIL